MSASTLEFGTIIYFWDIARRAIEQAKAAGMRMLYQVGGTVALTGLGAASEPVLADHPANPCQPMDKSDAAIAVCKGRKLCR